MGADMLENLILGPKPTSKTIDFIEGDVLFNLQKISERPEAISRLARSSGKLFINRSLSARADLSETSSPEVFWRVANEVISLLREGKTVYLHCNEGIHRTGMVALAVALTFESSMENALKIVREKREPCFEALTEHNYWRANHVYRAKRT